MFEKPSLRGDPLGNRLWGHHDADGLTSHSWFYDIRLSLERYRLLAKQSLRRST